MNHKKYWLMAIAVFNAMVCLENFAVSPIEDDGHGDVHCPNQHAVANTDDGAHGDVHNDPNVGQSVVVPKVLGSGMNSVHPSLRSHL